MNRKEAIDALVTAVEERDYGSILSFDEIGRIIGQQYGSIAFNTILNTARKRLITAGHMIVNVRGVGYKVCHPDSYTGEGVRYMRLGAQKIDRGTKIMNHAPVNDMSPEAREAHNRVTDRVTRLQAAMAGACVEIHMLSTNKAHPLLSAKEN